MIDISDNKTKNAIGILGGMGPQASARLYELIIAKSHEHRAIRSDEDYPEIVLLSVPVPNFGLNGTKSRGRARDMLADRVPLFTTSDCRIAGIACNTVHVFLDDVRAACTTPFLSLPELVSQHVAKKGYRRVGLFGTPATLSSKLYDTALSSVELVRPSEPMQDQLSEYIQSQLLGSISAAQRSAFRGMVRQFMEQNRLDSVVLACTELPLVYGQIEDDRIVDTLEVLADGLLTEYYRAST